MDVHSNTSDAARSSAFLERLAGFFTTAPLSLPPFRVSHGHLATTVRSRVYTNELVRDRKQGWLGARLGGKPCESCKQAVFCRWQTMAWHNYGSTSTTLAKRWAIVRRIRRHSGLHCIARLSFHNTATIPAAPRSLSRDRSQVPVIKTQKKHSPKPCSVRWSPRYIRR